MTSVDQFISNISAAATVDEIVLALRDEVSNRGIEWTTYEIVVSSEGRQLPFYNTNFPNAFLEQYAEEKFSKDDLTIGYAMEISRPFLWREVHHNPHLTPAQRRVVTAATASGLRSGAMIPLHGPGIVRSYVSIGSQMPIDSFTELFNAHFADRGRAFRAMVGADFTRSWAVRSLTDGDYGVRGFGRRQGRVAR